MKHRCVGQHMHQFNMGHTSTNILSGEVSQCLTFFYFIWFKIQRNDRLNGKSKLFDGRVSVENDPPVLLIC